MADPVIPGLQGKHSIGQGSQGLLWMEELRCAACHEGLPYTSMKTAPRLAEVGKRLEPEFVLQFLQDPGKWHPGTTMPALLGHLPEAARRDVAGDITAYLYAVSESGGHGQTKQAADPMEGRRLYHEMGCVACHPPRDDAHQELGGLVGASLAHVVGKYTREGLESFLRNPLHTRPSGRMPDLRLSPMEAAQLAAYLRLGAGEVPAALLAKASPAQIERGRKAFLDHQCVDCHEDLMPDLHRPYAGPALSRMNLDRGCLSRSPGKAPDFQLSDSQIEAIRVALSEGSSSLKPEERIPLEMTRLNCIACHQRGEDGGVKESLDAFFGSHEESLGNEARIPPPLTGIGAKLRPEWLNKVLYDGEAIRPYMKTRMPQFGREALSSWTDLFSQVDRMPSHDLPEPDQKDRRAMRDAGVLLLGEKGLNCIACHNHNGKESPGLKGMDLMTTFQRLQPAWFRAYLLNPAAFRPGIIMPMYWPDGVAIQTEILDGNTELQFQALWYHFSLGRSAADPAGIRSTPTVLQVTDRTRVYRGRSRVAGYRGIAVGFPGGLNYAFNAQNGALSAFWKGDFVRVGWQGQGAGDFQPLSRAVELSEDVAFLHGEKLGPTWPAHPVTSKENPVNPDPLYARSLGYRFLGYSLDPEGIPTFRYQCGPVTISDRLEPISPGDPSRLRRTWEFETGQSETLWLRPLSGALEKGGNGVMALPGLRLEAEGPPLRVLESIRVLPDGTREWILKLALPKGKSSYTIDYEIR